MYMCVYIYVHQIAKEKKKTIPSALEHPEVVTPHPSSKRAHSSSSACLGNVCKSRMNSHLTAPPRQVPPSRAI